MHINYIKTKNFGVLKDGTYNFTEGLNIIRGRNERGKTTLSEAILYGLFGTSALRGGVDDAVLDGRQPSELRVEGSYGDYTFKRSKSSASVVGPELKINGQNVVSEFFYDLLGVSKGNENNVLASKQGKTAGILDGKASEVTELIESLAGFSQLDELMESVKKNFPVGNMKIYEELVEKTTSLIEEESNKEFPSIADIDKEIVAKDKSLGSLKGELKTNTTKLKELETELTKLQERNKHRKQVERRICDLKETIKSINERIKKSEEEADIDVQDVTEEKAYVNSWTDLVAKWNSYVRVSKIKAWEGEEWEGTVDSLIAEVEDKKKLSTTLTEKIHNIKADIRHERKKINSDSTCDACGQDVTHLHEEINKRAEEEIIKLNKLLSKYEEDFNENSVYLEVVSAILSEQEKRSEYVDYVEDTGILPWKVRWSKAIPEEPRQEKFNSCSRRIKEAEKATLTKGAAKNKLKSLGSDLLDLQEKLSSEESELHKTSEHILDSLKEQVSNLSSEISEINKDLSSTTHEIELLKQDKVSVEKEISSSEKRLNELKCELEVLKRKIREEKRNKEVIKQVRTARPKVLNRVWGNVLMMVSETFSDLRGEPSKVEKSEKGFLINGLPVFRLSGSAKAILGIALRSALRDLFSPQARFLIFDEPAADGDEERTAAITAGLVIIPGQVIAITHEGISEQAAANIIDLDED